MPFAVNVEHYIGWNEFLVFSGGSTDLHPCSFLWRIRSFFPDASRFSLLQRCVRKYADTSNAVALKFPWRKLDIFVVPNWFVYTDSADENTRIVLSDFGILYMN